MEDEQIKQNIVKIQKMLYTKEYPFDLQEVIIIDFLPTPFVINNVHELKFIIKILISSMAKVPTDDFWITTEDNIEMKITISDYL